MTMRTLDSFQINDGLARSKLNCFPITELDPRSRMDSLHMITEVSDYSSMEMSTSVSNLYSI